MTRSQRMNGLDEEKNGRSAGSTVAATAGGAASAVGSGAKKVASTVAENPVLAATWAAAIGAAIGGTALALGSRLAPGTAQALRTSALWLHVVLLWPLPALLGFHVFKSYYF